jgi:hypothetical protein
MTTFLHVSVYTVKQPLFVELINGGKEIFKQSGIIKVWRYLADLIIDLCQTRSTHTVFTQS